jgi:acyl-CoA synthetase (NDP forming)
LDSTIKGYVRQKPILVHIIGNKDTVDSWTAQLEEENIPVYSSVERCVKALGCVWKYRLKQSKSR